MNSFFLAFSMIHHVFSNNVPNTEKIVGGVEVDKGRYPYQVALITGGFQYCGGTLVDKDWVLSAAHCYGLGDRVYIGRHDLTDSSEKFESIEIDWETQHPDYNGGNLANDFMMIKLKKSSSVKPVKVDDGSVDLPSGTDVTVMGWGTTSFGGSPSAVLMEVEVDIVSNSHCNSDYGGGISDSMMCASRSEKDSCQGDSGGPLIVKGKYSSQDTQVGVVSWGYGCADANYPGVYARISKQIQWIKTQIESGTKPEDDDEGDDNGDDLKNWDDENDWSNYTDDNNDWFNYTDDNNDWSNYTDDKNDWYATDDKNDWFNYTDDKNDGYATDDSNDWSNYTDDMNDWYATDDKNDWFNYTDDKNDGYATDDKNDWFNYTDDKNDWSTTDDENDWSTTDDKTDWYTGDDAAGSDNNYDDDFSDDSGSTSEILSEILSKLLTLVTLTLRGMTNWLTSYDGGEVRI